MHPRSNFDKVLSKKKHYRNTFDRVLLVFFPGESFGLGFSLCFWICLYVVLELAIQLHILYMCIFNFAGTLSDRLR